MSAENEVLVRYTGPGPAVLAGLYIGNGELRWVTRGALDQARGTHPEEHFEEVETRPAHAADDLSRAPAATANMSTDISTPPTYDAQGRIVSGGGGAAPQFVAGGVEDTGASNAPAPRFVEGLDYPTGHYPTGGVPPAAGPEASGGANPVPPPAVPEVPAAAPHSGEPWPEGVSGSVAPAVNLPQEDSFNAPDAAKSELPAAKRGRSAK